MHMKDLVEESVIHVTSALVGNWLSTLTFKSTASVSDTALTRITIISEIDASVFFYIELPLDEATALIECLQQLSTAIAEDSSNLSVRIELGKTTALLVLDICDGPKRFLLTRPTTMEMNNHLLSTLSRNRLMYQNEKRLREDLEEKLRSTEVEVNLLKQQAVWNEKELELMKLLVRSSSAGFQPDITMKNVHMRSENGVDTHCKSCNCHTLNKKIPEKSMLGNQKGNMDGRAMEMDAQENVIVMVEPDSRSSDEMKMLTVKHNLNRDASTELNSSIGSTSSQSQDLLLGVAQYILCQLCPEQAPDIKVMEDHFLRTHVDKEKQHCEACPSDLQPDLIQHMRRHTNKIYACNFCGKRGRKHYLKAHIRTHTGEKPFNCETCGRSFADGSTLRRHRLVHSGEKKHTCPICGRGIARKDNVKTHIRSHGIKC